jgi:hypothetical protein
MESVWWLLFFCTRVMMVIVMLIHYFPTLSSFSNDPVFALSMHDFSISSYGIRQALIVLLDNVPARITRRDRTCPRSRIEMRDYRPRIAELTA